MRGHARSELRRWPVFFFYGIAENLADFFFHAAPVTFSAALQALLHTVFQIANDKLSHNEPQYRISMIDIMISENSEIQTWLTTRRGYIDRRSDRRPKENVLRR